MPSDVSGARVPPHSDAAERSVLGSMLVNEQCADTAMGALQPDDFYLPFHQAIFAAMASLSARRQRTDLVSVVDQLDRNGTMPPEGLEYLTSLASDLLVVDNIKNHVRMVREKSTLRKLIDLNVRIAGACYEGKKDASALLEEAADAIYRLSDEGSRNEVIHIRPALMESYRVLSEVMKKKGGLMGVSTGFPMMDSMLSGLQDSQLIVVAGRPGMGKTSFALNIVHHASLVEKATCLVFSLEMSATQLATRLLCSESRTDMQLARTGRLGSDDFGKLYTAIGDLEAAPIYLDDTATISVSEMVAKSRRLQREHGLGLVVIDYLQLMRGTGRVENRTQEVSQITRALKIMAKDLNVPIVLLSQLSRAGEKEGSKYPKLSELRESGAIEQDADVVIFLQRDDYYVDQQTPENIGSARIIVAKQRNGPTGAISVRWDGKYTRYREEDLAHAEEAEY